jgi:hypothetical protein
MAARRTISCSFVSLTMSGKRHSLLLVPSPLPPQFEWKFLNHAPRIAIWRPACWAPVIVVVSRSRQAQSAPGPAARLPVGATGRANRRADTAGKLVRSIGHSLVLGRDIQHSLPCIAIRKQLRDCPTLPRTSPEVPPIGVALTHGTLSWNTFLILSLQVQRSVNPWSDLASVVRRLPTCARTTMAPEIRPGYGSARSIPE